MDSRDNHAGLSGTRNDNIGARSDALAKGSREFICVAVPKVFSAALQLVVNLLLIRQLGPELSGIVFVCITAILLGDAVLGSALDVAVIRLATGQRSGDPSEGIEVQKAAVLIKLVACVLFCIPILIWAAPLSQILFHGESQANVLLLSMAALFGLLLLRSVQTSFQVSRRFVLYGITDLLHNGFKFGGLGLMLWLHLVTPVSVLALYVASPLLVATGMLVTACGDMLRAKVSKASLHSLLGLSKWYVGGAAAGSITSRMDIFLVSAFAGSTQAGIFSAAQNTIVPFQLLGMYLGIVFAPRIMPLWEQGRLLPIYRQFQTALLVFCFVAYGIALVGASVFPASLIPKSFQAAPLLILLLLPTALAALMNFPWTVSFLMFSHPRFLMYFDACSFAVLGLIYWQCIIRYGAAGAALVTSAFALLKTAVLQVLAIRTLTKQSQVSPHLMLLSTPEPSPAAS